MVAAIVQLFRELGLCINEGKSVLQLVVLLEHLGFLLDIAERVMYVTDDKLARMR